MRTPITLLLLSITSVMDGALIANPPIATPAMDPVEYFHPHTPLRTMRSFTSFALAGGILLSSADLSGNVYDATLLDHVGLRFPCFNEVTPVLKIQNTGTVVMTSCVVETWKNGISLGGFTWVLNDPAAPGDIREPHLPPVLDVNPGDALEFHIITVNDEPDENPSGNLLVVLMGTPAVSDAFVVRVHINTGSEPGSVQWRITDAEGRIAAQAGPFNDAFTDYEQWVELDANGCYMVHLDQPGGASTEADLQLYGLEIEILSLGGPGGDERIGLTTGNVVSIPERAPAERLVIFPNPSTGPITLRLNDPMTRPDAIRISDTAGRVVLVEHNLPGLLQPQLDLSPLASGSYFVQVIADDRVLGSGRVSIQH